MLKLTSTTNPVNQPTPIETGNMLDLSRQNTEIKRDLEEDEKAVEDADEDGEDSGDNLDDDIDEKADYNQQLAGRLSPDMSANDITIDG